MSRLGVSMAFAFLPPEMRLMPVPQSSRRAEAGHGARAGSAAFAAFAEGSAFERVERKTTGRPVGWELSNYAGPSDGWDEVIGYYRGIDKVEA